MITLFDDQAETIEKVRQAQRGGEKYILLQSPTGSGKTAMGVSMIYRARAKDKRMVFTVPRRELMKQTSETFTKHGIDHSFIAAGHPFNPYAKVHIGMVDTMARRLDKLPKVDLAFHDETHFGESALESVIKHYRDRQGAWGIGLSATPWKLNGRGLGHLYGSMVQGPSMRWLIDNKRLSDYRFFVGRTKPDLSSLKIVGGDYAKADLAHYMEEQGVIIGDCVNDYRQRAMGRLHIVRCASIKHSQKTAESFRTAGIPAMHVDGETPDDEMRSIIRAFARREILVLTFCDLLNFGFDLAQASGMDVCIESGSDLKPSMSLAGQMQFWGRMMRYKPYPALLMDNVNNHLNHGLPCSDRLWTLADRIQKKGKGGEKAPPTKQCDKCFLIYAPAEKCPECGHINEVQSRKIDEVEGTLEEIDPLTMREKRLEEQGRAKSLEDLIKIAYGRGYKPGNAERWAAHILASRLKKQQQKRAVG